MRDDPSKCSPSQMKHSSSQVRRPLPEMKSEIIAQQIFKKLLAKRSFQKYLIDSTVKEILNDVGPADTTTYGQQLIFQNLGFESSTSCRRVIIHQNVDLLICHLKLIVESFIKSSNLAFCDIGANINRDAAALFSVRLQLEQFVNSDHFHLLRFEQFIRRLYTLLRCFAARISTPFQIANCAFFASCLCDMLYRLEEFCSIHEKNFTSKFEQLRKAIDIFHNVIVRRLNEMITGRIKEEYKTKKVAKRKASEISPLRRTPHRPKSAATFREVQQTLHRSPGYLLPYDLHEKRRLMQSRRATTSFPPSKQRFSKFRDTQQKIQQETVYRLAHEITKEMVNGLAARVDDVAIISKC
ncbi:hypothetical protein WUBG_01777 [Wuchereria bancrofti]|uniref:Uncharacterized protein n=1 Tax=Wuchereria bancrofti TaxID=6293 RepID=J9EXH9_WUCBA|nr:hypothetical protein WUBG_01777 [Wuchereria bancrofti]